ncbi:MAG TPA: glycoside hydrolase family 2 [Verrucomicrobiae bacterium]|nr:glycoside hydrolase family 2 [Verrucomicrobiae bacterium]
MRTCLRLHLLLPVLLFSTISVFGSAPAPEDSISLLSGWQLQDASKVSDNGGVISKPDYQPAGWLAATVPGTVLTSLVNDGVYPEPLYGTNNLRIPDSLSRVPFWYRMTFVVPQSFNGKHVWLNFDGVNYAANVWINGYSIGGISGAFERGIFDVTKKVVPGSMAAVAVEILPEPYPGQSHQKTIATGTGKNGGVTARDGPTFLCSIGWDWIPTIRDRDIGIWQNVSLSATGPVVLRDPYVTSDLPLPRTDTADLAVQATVENVTRTREAGVLSGEGDGDIRFSQSVSLNPGETRTIVFSPANTVSLHLKNPRLWWPNGYGAPNLCHLHVSFTVNGMVSDAREIRFGIRKITYSVPGSTNLTLVVNGVPVVAKGGDWGMDEAMKRISHAKLDTMIHLHQQANYDIIRNWVGQSTSEDFYEACDKYGILVWDEFFQPNPADGPNPDDANLYWANVREKILRFRQHPCIALWCARNEGNPPPVLGAGIQQLINKLDDGRLYQPSSTSGRGVHSSGPYHWRTPREFYSFPKTEAFKTEIGSMSVPTLEAIHAMMPSNDWNVINDDWAEHDFCKGAQQGNRYPGILSSRYGATSSLADFVRKSQLANYEAFRAMYEGRFAKLFNPVTGVITWMSNPAQPSFVWQLYSHDLEPNASLFATRKACEPVHIQMNQNNWHVLVINNTPKALNGLKAKTMVFNLDGTLAYSHVDKLDAAPSAATDAGEIAFPVGLSAVHFVKLELRDRHNHPLSDNFYWRSGTDDPDDFRALNQLPQVPLGIRARSHTESGECVLNVIVQNPTRSVVLMAHLQLRRAGSGKRVLPVFYSDNYISLLPGETRSLTIEAATSDLNGEAPSLTVDGWNVTVNTASASRSPVRVTPNVDALDVGPDATPLAGQP